MSYYDLLKDIIIPIVSAVFGGLITMLGVIITIKWERKKEQKARTDSAKPWIYSLNEHENTHDNESNEIHLVPKESDFPKDECLKRAIIIKNASSSIGVINSFQTATVKYTPHIGKVLDKDEVTKVIIHLKPHEEQLKEMRLFVSDVFDNTYEYEVIADSACKTWQISEITRTKRRNKKHRKQDIDA